MSQLQNWPWPEQHMRQLVSTDVYQFLKEDSTSTYDLLKSLLYHFITSKQSTTIDDLNAILLRIDTSLMCRYHEWAVTSGSIPETVYNQVELKTTDVGMLSNQLRSIYPYWNNIATELNVPVSSTYNFKLIASKFGCREALESLLEIYVMSNKLTLVQLRMAVCRISQLAWARSI